MGLILGFGLSSLVLGLESWALCVRCDLGLLWLPWALSNHNATWDALHGVLCAPKT